MVEELDQFIPRLSSERMDWENMGYEVEVPDEEVGVLQPGYRQIDALRQQLERISSRLDPWREGMLTNPTPSAQAHSRTSP